MYFYRAMSVNEYLRFLDGEKISCEGPKGSTGKMCMMPGIIDVEDVGIVDVTTFYKNAMTDIVNPEVFVKFEIHDNDLQNLINSNHGILVKMPYHFCDREVMIEELQLTHYNNTICTPISIQLWNSDFAKNYPTIDANSVVPDNLRIDSMFQHATGANSYVIGVDFSYAGAHAVGYDFSNVTSLALRDLVIGRMIYNYNQKYENMEIADNYVGLNRQLHSDINLYLLKEFNDKYYFSNQEFGDYEKFFHSENIVKNILEYKKEEINDEGSQILAAMRTALNSDKRFFINTSECEVIASKVNVFETDNFVVENITYVNNEYHVPVWKVQSKDSQDFAYLDTESVLELCRTENISRFMLDGVENVGGFQFTFKQREFESYSDMLVDAQNTFGMTVNDIRHEIYQKLFSVVSGINESDLFLYKTKDFSGLDIPKISFGAHDFVVSIDDIDNPQKVIISKNNEEYSFIELSNDVNALKNVFNLINSVEFSDANKFCSIVNNCMGSGLSVEETKETLDKVFSNSVETDDGVNKRRYLSLWHSSKENLVNTLESNCGDNWNNVANFLFNSNFDIHFTKERGLTFYNSEYICNINNSQDGYSLDISKSFGKNVLTTDCHSIEEAILKIKDTCCEKYLELQQKYPELAQYDSYGVLLKAVDSFALEYKESDNKIIIRLEHDGLIEVENGIADFYKVDNSGDKRLVKSEDVSECTSNDIAYCGEEPEFHPIHRFSRDI